MLPLDDFLTVAEIAATLKLNQQTVRNWIDAGMLPAFHVGRRVRIRGSDFEAFLAEGYRGTAASASHPKTTTIWAGTCRSGRAIGAVAVGCAETLG